jgi:hypothetical protein
VPHHQPPEDSTSADSKSLKAPFSIERRTLLLGATALAAGGLSTQASAATQAPDLSAALAKFRASAHSVSDVEFKLCRSSPRTQLLSVTEKLRSCLIQGLHHMSDSHSHSAGSSLVLIA